MRSARSLLDGSALRDRVDASSHLVLFPLLFVCFGQISGDTIHVSNLAPDVSDDDVREIFERIGAVKSCVVNFNSAGKSTGTATVTFHKKNDAEKAVEDYDEAEVDGRPMKLKLIGSVVSAPVVVKKTKPAAPVIVQQALPQLAYMPQLGFQQPLQYAPSYQQAPRVKQQQQQQQAPARGGATRGGRSDIDTTHSTSARCAGQRAFDAGFFFSLIAVLCLPLLLFFVFSGGRGGAASAASAPARGGAKAARAPRAAPKEVSGADLDKEMDAYHSAKAAPAADAAPAAGQPTNA